MTRKEKRLRIEARVTELFQLPDQEVDVQFPNILLQFLQAST